MFGSVPKSQMDKTRLRRLNRRELIRVTIGIGKDLGLESVSAHVPSQKGANHRVIIVLLR